jgi:protein phosphatase
MTEEITGEYPIPELVAAIPLQAMARVTIACKTDLGRVRENNEDKFEFFIPEDERTLASRGLVFVVCDGMGGHAAGQIASELACKTFIDVYLNHPSADASEAARAAVIAANRFVLDVGRAIPARRGMGTTLSALILIQRRAMVVHVGDSRVYRMRKGQLMRLTEDHTAAEEMVRLGQITPEEAKTHPHSHMLLRVIGIDEINAIPDIDSMDLEPGDVFLLCSDGLTNHVEDEEIALQLAKSPSEAAWKLVVAALAGGGSDNCTAMVVRVDELVRAEAQ